MFCPSILFINLTRLRWTMVKLGYIKIRPAHVDVILCVNTAVYLTKSEAMSHRARLLFSKQVSPTRARACVGVVGWLANVYKREWDRERRDAIRGRRTWLIEVPTLPPERTSRWPWSIGLPVRSRGSVTRDMTGRGRRAPSSSSRMQTESFSRLFCC